MICKHVYSIVTEPIFRNLNMNIWKPFIWMLSRIIISWVFQYTFGYVYLKFSICVLYVTQYYAHVNVRCKIIGIKIYHPNLMKHHMQSLLKMFRWLPTPLGPIDAYWRYSCFQYCKQLKLVTFVSIFDKIINITSKYQSIVSFLLFVKTIKLRPFKLAF